jgi:hypothetical protein
VSRQNTSTYPMWTHSFQTLFPFLHVMRYLLSKFTYMNEVDMNASTSSNRHLRGSNQKKDRNNINIWKAEKGFEYQTKNLNKIFNESKGSNKCRILKITMFYVLQKSLNLWPSQLKSDIFTIVELEVFVFSTFIKLKLLRK